MYEATPRKDDSMTSSAMRPLNREAAVPEALTVLAVSEASAAEIWVIFSAIFSAICSAEEDGDPIMAL